MKNFYENNDDKFNSKLQNFEFDFAPKAWDDMSKRLDKLQQAKGGGAGWWKWACVSAGVILGSSGIGWGLYASYSATKLPITETNTQKQSNVLSIESTTAKTDVVATDKNYHTITGNETANTTDKVVATPIVANKTVASVAPVYRHSEERVVKYKAPSTARTLPNTTNNSITTNNNTSNNQNAENTVVNAVNQQITNQYANNTNSDNVSEEELQPNRITKVSHFYSLSLLPEAKIKAENGLQLQQFKNDKDSSLFFIDRIADQWQSHWEAGVVGGAVAKHYTDAAKGISGYVGAFVRWKASSHHAIEMGIQYKNLPHNKTNEPKTYYTNDAMLANGDAAVTAISTIKDFHLLELPINYRFSPHPKHHILVGIKGSYLVGVRTNMPEMQLEQSKKALGLNSFDAAASMGYEFSLCEHLGLGFQYNVGFTNWASKATKQHSENLQNAGFNAVNDVLEINNQTVPTAVESLKVIEVPRKIRNNDLQVFLKYTF